VALPYNYPSYTLCILLLRCESHLFIAGHLLYDRILKSRILAPVGPSFVRASDWSKTQTCLYLPCFRGFRGNVKSLLYNLLRRAGIILYSSAINAAFLYIGIQQLYQPHSPLAGIELLHLPYLPRLCSYLQKGPCLYSITYHSHQRPRHMPTPLKLTNLTETPRHSRYQGWKRYGMQERSSMYQAHAKRKIRHLCISLVSKISSLHILRFSIVRRRRPGSAVSSRRRVPLMRMGDDVKSTEGR
jgi:hypothetical protein